MVYRKEWTIFILLCLNQIGECQDSGMVAGVGYGVFVIIFGFAISIIISILSRSTRFPIQISFFGLLIPIILIIFFSTAPKESQKLAKEQRQEFQEDYTVVSRWVSFSIFFATFLLSLFYLLTMKCFRNSIAVRVGTLSFAGKRERKESTGSSSSDSSDNDEDGKDKVNFNEIPLPRINPESLIGKDNENRNEDIHNPMEGIRNKEIGGKRLLRLRKE